MFKKIFVLFLFVLIAGCSSKSSSPYNVADNANMPESPKYKIGTVKVNLIKKYDNENYPDQEAISKLFLTKLKNALVKAGRYSEDSDITLNLELDYRRIFVGEAFGMKSKFGGSRFTYKSSLLMNGAEVSTHNSAEYIATHGLFVGVYRSFKVIFGLAGPQDEIDDINVYIKLLMHQLP